MGSRSDQIVGITKEARDFIEKNQAVPEPCSKCKRPFSPNSKTCGIFTGMFGHEYPLFEYELKNGKIAQKKVQADPWSSGPVFFIKLVVSDEKEYMWTEEEMQKYL